jgi:hypothetical protein
MAEAGLSCQASCDHQRRRRRILGDGSRARRALDQWMPALGGLAHFPFAVAFLLWPDTGGLWFLMPSALFGGLWAAPGHAMVQSLARPQMRATASALMLLLFNLIGFGLGPWIVGLLNDLLEPQFGAQSIRWSLLVIACASLWAAARALARTRHDASSAPAPG